MDSKGRSRTLGSAPRPRRNGPIFDRIIRFVKGVLLVLDISYAGIE